MYLSENIGGRGEELLILHSVLIDFNIELAAQMRRRSGGCMALRAPAGKVQQGEIETLL